MDNLAIKRDMTANEYQKAALRTAQLDKFQPEELRVNGALGLCGEAGEVADLIKKVEFQGHRLDIGRIAEELGDCVWYIALTAHAIGYTLDDIFQMNVDKLVARYPDGFDKNRSIHREEG